MGLEDMARSHRRGAIVAAESDEAASNLHHETTPSESSSAFGITARAA